MKDLIIASAFSIVIVIAGFVVAWVVGRMMAMSNTGSEIDRRLDIAGRLQGGLDKRRAQLEASLARERGRLERAREQQARLARRAESTDLEPEFAIRVLQSLPKATDDVYLVTVSNRKVRPSADPDLPIDVSWMQPQSVLVRATRAEEARGVVVSAFPNSLGFTVISVQKAPPLLAALVPPPNMGAAAEQGL